MCLKTHYNIPCVFVFQIETTKALFFRCIYSYRHLLHYPKNIKWKVVNAKERQTDSTGFNREPGVANTRGENESVNIKQCESTTVNVVCTHVE